MFGSGLLGSALFAGNVNSAINIDTWTEQCPAVSAWNNQDIQVSAWNNQSKQGSAWTTQQKNITSTEKCDQQVMK